MVYKTILICMFINISLCGKPPVLIWGSERSDSKPSFNVISSEDFSSFVKDELKNSMVVAFLEKELSNEDLSHCKTNCDLPCFKNLTQFTPQTYYTKVDAPMNSLRNVANKKEYLEASADGNLDHPLLYEPGKVVFVNFKDDDKESRENILHNHDLIIAEIYKSLSNFGKVVAVYTSSGEMSQTRRVRQASSTQQAPEPNKPKWFNVGGKCLIYFSELKKTTDSSDKFETVNIEKAILSNDQATEYDIDLNDDKGNKLTLKINFVGGYWKLTELNWSNEKFRVVPQITVPEGLSYYCGITSEYISDKKTKLQWTGLQIQPFQKESNNRSFDDPWHCVGFTSAGIWGGLFVTFMLLGIMSIGISWLMDIKTMDRFDDPKGKTITINAAE